MNTETVLGGGRFIGQSVKRHEDRRLLTGRGEFVDDVSLPGMLHAAFVRSPHPHARIQRIDVDSALAVDGVIAVFTATDLAPLARTLEGSSPHQNSAHFTAEPLASSEVKYVGDPVAVVLARDRYVAEDGCELVEVEYEVLDAVIDYEEAFESSIWVHPSMESNVTWVEDLAGRVAALMEGTSYDADNLPDPRKALEDPQLQEAFANSAYVFEETFHQHRMTHSPMETCGILADWDPATERLNVWLATQNVHDARSCLARVLGIPDNHVQVSAQDVGGSFGQKAMVGREEYCAVLASRLLGRPVKWIEDRYENLSAKAHARSCRLTARLGFDAEGRITAASNDYLEELGAYPIGGENVQGGALCCLMFPGPYRVPAYRYRGCLVFTHTCGRAPYRGPWMMETVAREQLLDIAARGMGIDPLELRRRNTLAPEDLPYTTPMQMEYRDISPMETLERSAHVLDYEKARAEQRAARAEDRLVGIGIGAFVEPTGFPSGALGVEVATLRVTPLGSVDAFVGTGSHGHSIETTMAQIVAERLGVAVDDVVIHQGDTRTAPFGGGTGGSRTAVIAGAVCRIAAGELRERVLAIAGEMMEAAPEDLDMEDGVISVRGAPTHTLTLGEVAQVAYMEPFRLPEGVRPGLEHTTRFAASSITYSNATHICVCEIDRTTGIVRLLRYIVSEDCGVMINPSVVEGQIAGGVAQGIGGALLEHSPCDDAGNPLATTYMDYLLPTIADIPRIEFDHVVTPSSSPGGFKGMGEGGAIVSPAAVLNAIADALSPLGISVSCQPVTPSQILAGIQDRTADPLAT